MRIDHEKKSDMVILHHKKKSDRVRVWHKKGLLGESPL